LLDTVPFAMPGKELRRQARGDNLNPLTVLERSDILTLHGISAPPHHFDKGRVRDENDRPGVQLHKAFEDAGHQEIRSSMTANRGSINSRCAAAPLEY
jgi:hypothetical protein